MPFAQSGQFFVVNCGMRLRLLELIVFALVGIVLITGCCEQDEYVPTNDAYHRFTQHHLMTFVDSAGNHLQLLFNEEGLNAVLDYDSYYSDCEKYYHYPWARFDFLPPNQGEIKYLQSSDGSTLVFPEFSIGGSSGDIGVTVQGFHYPDCRIHTRSDSTGEFASAIVDREYGLVMFSYRDEYRWERVLEW